MRRICCQSKSGLSSALSISTNDPTALQARVDKTESIGTYLGGGDVDGLEPRNQHEPTADVAPIAPAHVTPAPINTSGRANADVVLALTNVAAAAAHVAPAAADAARANADVVVAPTNVAAAAAHVAPAAANAASDKADTVPAPPNVDPAVRRRMAAKPVPSKVCCFTTEFCLQSPC
jgi:hypothetical protein